MPLILLVLLKSGFILVRIASRRNQQQFIVTIEIIDAADPRLAWKPLTHTQRMFFESFAAVHFNQSHIHIINYLEASAFT